MVLNEKPGDLLDTFLREFCVLDVVELNRNVNHTADRALRAKNAKMGEIVTAESHQAPRQESQCICYGKAGLSAQSQNKLHTEELKEIFTEALERLDTQTYPHGNCV